MKMTAGKRAIDKIYKRRDRYEIPDWQREEVWDQAKKQQLIDSILRGWKLPKFYFTKVAEDEYEVVDGQQRLQSIYEFFDNELKLSAESQKVFRGATYRELPVKFGDAFDDFEIEFDAIEDADEEELKMFFQRLQQGLPLTSSEKLNSVHSKLRDFCRKLAQHGFFKAKISIPNTRYAHFDILAKVAAIEIEGLDVGLRFDDLKKVFDANREFSPTSATAKRMKAALDFLDPAFSKPSPQLRSRTVVQSLITIVCSLVSTKHAAGYEKELGDFFDWFGQELGRQIELGNAATDSDFLVFQRSVNANVKTGARTRHEVLIRKLFAKAPGIAALFDPTVIAKSGTSGRVKEIGESIVGLINVINKTYSSKHGEDLFKATNKTAHAQLRIAKPAKDLEDYRNLIDQLYFLFREAPGQRLTVPLPTSFVDVNDLRTYLRHDVDHGDRGKVRSKLKKTGIAFARYAGTGTPETIDPGRFVLVQANLLNAIEGDLKKILIEISK